MKRGNLFTLLLCLVAASIFLVMSTGAQEPEEQPKFSTVVVAKGNSPVWSPDGTKLAFIIGSALYVVGVNGTEQPSRVADLPEGTSGFVWADSSEFLLWEFERNRVEAKPGWEQIVRIKRLYSDGRIELVTEDRSVGYKPRIGPPMVLNDGTVGYFENIGSPSERFEIINAGELKAEIALKEMRAIPSLALPYLKREGTLDSDVGIWLESMDGTVKRHLCADKTFAYSCPQLSRGQDKILAANAVGPDYGLFILDLNCEVLAYLGGGIEDSIELAPGLYGRIGGGGSTARWSPDGRYVLEVASAEDERTIVASDLFLLKADGTERIRLTNTPNVIEGAYTWSPVGSKIAFVAGTERTIYVVKLE